MVLLTRLILSCAVAVVVLGGCGPNDVAVELGGKAPEPVAGFSPGERYDTLVVSMAGQTLLTHARGHFSTLNLRDGTIDEVHISDLRRPLRGDAPELVASMARRLTSLGWKRPAQSADWPQLVSHEALTACFDAAVYNTVALPPRIHPVGAKLNAFLDCRTSDTGARVVGMRLLISLPQ